MSVKTGEMTLTYRTLSRYGWMLRCHGQYPDGEDCNRIFVEGDTVIRAGSKHAKYYCLDHYYVRPVSPNDEPVIHWEHEARYSRSLRGPGKGLKTANIYNYY